HGQTRDAPRPRRHAPAIARVCSEAVDAVFPEGATMANRVALANFAIAQRLPSMFGWSEYAAAGGLMSYGASPARRPCTARRLRRQDSQGRAPGRPARRAAHQVPAGYQPQDREGAGSDDSPLATAAGGSGHRVITIARGARRPTLGGGRSHGPEREDHA